MNTQIGKMSIRGKPVPLQTLRSTPVRSEALDELWRRVRARLTP